MLRSIFIRNVCKNLPKMLSANCSTRTSVTLKKEINRVTLVGTVYGEQFKNDLGQKIIKVKTNEDGGNKYQIHTLFTSVPQDYETGQRVFVGGTLNSREFTTSENKSRLQHIIKAYQIYALNSMVENGIGLKDSNSVELLTTVCANVINKDDYSVFTVVTHTENRETQTFRPNFHRVSVRDQDLCKFVGDNLGRGDRVYLKGSLVVNRAETNVDGKRRHIGYINLETVEKLTNFNLKHTSEEETTFAE